MKSIRVLITDQCNAKCPNCINRRIRTEKALMDVGLFEQLCVYFEEAKVGNIRIMGGEPSVHPDFEMIVKIAQEHFSRVTVFSNGLDASLEKFSPREQDGVNYNFNFSRHWVASRFLPHYLGRRTLEIVVSRQTDSLNIISELKRIFEMTLIPFVVSLSFDCTENIFKYKSVLLPKIMDIKHFCEKSGVETIVDHSVPFCFIYGTKFPTTSKGAICNEECAGLVDANFNLRFCNQYNEKSLPIIDNGRFVPFEIVNNFIRYNFYRNQLSVMDKMCRDCVFYGKYCNGGCFMANPAVTRNDVLANTDFPLK